MTELSSESGGFKALGELARNHASAPVSPSAHATGRMRLMIAAASLRRGGEGSFARWSRPLMAAAGVTAIALCATAVLLYMQPRPLQYEVVGGQRFASNYIGALPTEPAQVKFSDGSNIEARPGSRLRIDETHADGARVLVERGTASARVRHRDRSRWVFAAGPFNVRVIGTRFDLDWDPQAQVVSLTLHEGAVEVESPVGQSRCTVHAGQRFKASLQAGTMTLESIDAKPAADSGVSAAAAAKAAPTEAAGVSNARRSDGNDAKDAKDAKRVVTHAMRARWGKLVRRGEFEAVVEQALAGDLDATLKSCTAGEARALADAARYTDRPELAERVLLTIRARFPGTRHGDAAGFLLGRTSETRGKAGDADRWYTRYLGEAPEGEYAADALAGRMRALLAMSGAAAARPIAREYLRRFPDGVHLRMARRLAGSEADTPADE